MTPPETNTSTIRHAVVTGATGHVGNALVRALLARRIPVRVVVRTTSDLVALEGLEAERVDGDVSDRAALEAAFRGADVVFHVAALVSITAGQEARLERTNVEGTRNVVEACVAAGVRRLVYTSSVHALPEPAGGGGALDEDAEFDPAQAYGAYGRSKAAASALVRRAARDGRLDAVLVLPTGCIGPYDFRLSELGQLVSMAGRGVLPVIIGGGYHFVDVRDVAEGTILAAQKAPSGEAYLLDAGYMSSMDLCRVVAQHAGVRPPLVTIPLPVVQPFAVLGLLWEKTTGRRALLTPYSVHTLAARYDISAAKAQRELGFAPRPLAQSLADAWTWLSTDPRSPLKRGKTTAKPARL